MSERLELEYIEWDDAYVPSAEGAWIAADDDRMNIDDPVRIVSVGYVLRENEHFVQMAASVSPALIESGDTSGATVSGVINIPRGMIHRRVTLREPARRKK